MKKILLNTLALVVTVPFAQAQEPTLVKEIDTVQNESSSPKYLTSFNNRLYFTADAKRFNGFGMVMNPEVWSSDGSESGTSMLTDLNKISASENTGSYPQGLKAWKNKLYFFANGYPMPYQELYESDGTEAGTKKITSLELAVWVPGGLRTETLTEFKDELYFVAGDAAHGYELWKTNGTSAGTVLVKDINPEGGMFSSAADIHQLTVMGDKLYFFANDQANDDSLQIWKTDGTNAGTEKILTYRVGNSETLNCLRATATHLYFTYQKELYKSDGTAAGTSIVVNRTPDGSFSPEHMTEFNNEIVFVYYTTNPLTHHLAITSSDPKGYTELKESSSIFEAAHSTYYMPMIVVDGKLYFSLSNSGNEDLWISDGTVNGTRLLKTFASATEGSVVGSEFVKHNNEIYFVTELNGAYYINKTDGTTAGTVKVTTEGLDETLKNLTSVNDVLFFVGADQGQFGNDELWKLGTGTTGGGTTGIAEKVRGNEAVNIYPNPANEEVSIALNGEQAVSIALFDITGKQVASVQPGVSIITHHIADLPAGQYFYRIQTKSAVSTHKLIICR